MTDNVGFGAEWKGTEGVISYIRLCILGSGGAEIAFHISVRSESGQRSANDFLLLYRCDLAE